MISLGRRTYAFFMLACLHALACDSDTSSDDNDAGASSGGSSAAGTGGSPPDSGSTSGAGGTSTEGGTSGAAGQGGRAGAAGAAPDAGGGTAGRAGGGGSAGARDASNDGDVRADARDAPGVSDASTMSDASSDGSLDGNSGASDALVDASGPPQGDAACTALPSSGLYATFRVVNDVFSASMTNATGISQALSLWQGQSQAKIPVGKLDCTSGTFNCGFSWSMIPDTITFAELTIEVCDATPSYIESNCTSFPNAQYCPWSAELIALRDCRTDPSCPALPR